MGGIAKKLKIGIVSDTYLPIVGGAEIHIQNLANFLKRANFEVEIMSNTPGEGLVDGIKIWRNKGSGFKACRLLRDLKNVRRFVKSFDLIHSHYTFYLAFLSGLWAKILRKPVVVTLHGLGTLDSSMTNLRRRFFRYFSFKLADMVIATSQEMADVARHFVKKEKIVIIPNGVDTEFFKPAISDKRHSDKSVVLTVRRLHPKNGVQYLIEAIPYITEKITNIEFLIAGQDKLENYLRERVKELKVENFVKFIGEIPNEKTRDYYNRADIVVFPSSAESTSIACLEAMACQRAVAASALQVYKEMLGNNQRGILVKLFDREYSDYNAPLTLPEDKIRNLAQAIIELAKNPELRQSIGRAARQFVVENYDWRMLVKRIETIYSKLIR